MNILFLTLLDFRTIEEKGIYTDLMREFAKNGHRIYIVSPFEKRKNDHETLLEFHDCKILKLEIGNMQKTNMIEKGISTLTLERKFVKGIKKYFSKVKFDLVLYSTPPITLQKAVSFVKQRDKAISYLLLKDIFPQNAVDLGMIRKHGLKGIIYRYFRLKEIQLYKASNYIGCMSDANRQYIIDHNPKLNLQNIEVCPNSLDPIDIYKDKAQNESIKMKYNIPLEKTIIIYGGNLGKPQGVDFLLECLIANKSNEKVQFVIVGSGTEYKKIHNFLDSENLPNVQLFREIPREDYELLVQASDVGLIFLDKRFTIPNFPSRLLSYMQASMPVIAATDVATDIGKIIEIGNFGLWTESGDIEKFNHHLHTLTNVETRKQMGINARKYMEQHYTAAHSYEIIMKHFVRREIIYV